MLYIVCRDIYKAMVMDMDKAVEDVVATLKADCLHFKRITFYGHVKDEIESQGRINLFEYLVIAANTFLKTI
jgi:hypothetical protein